MTDAKHVVRVIPAMDPQRTAGQRSAIWRVAEELRNRTRWCANTAHFQSSWVVTGVGRRWRVGSFASLFFDLNNPRGPATVFSVHPELTASGARPQLGPTQIAWIERLHERLGERYRAEVELLRERHQVMFALRRTTDPLLVLREFDHVAKAVDGVRRTTRVTRRSPRKADSPAQDLLAISSTLVSTGGPWRLAGLGYWSEVKARYGGSRWIVSAHLGLSISSEQQCGLSTMLFVWREGRAAAAAVDKWGWLRDTKRELKRAGYKLMQSSKRPEDVHFHRFVPTTRRTTLDRELDRIERRLTAAQE